MELGASVRVKEEGDLDEALRRLRQLAQPIDTGIFSQGTQANDLEVSSTGQTVNLRYTEAYVEFRIGQAIQQSIEIIRQRIDELGVTEPTIQRQGISRILVQVPGLEDTERLKDIIGTTAQLKFRCSVRTRRTPLRGRPARSCPPRTAPISTIRCVRTSHRR